MMKTPLAVKVFPMNLAAYDLGLYVKSVIAPGFTLRCKNAPSASTAYSVGHEVTPDLAG